MTIKNNPADDVISIIVPCFNEESVLPAFYSAVSDAASSIEGAVCEFLFIDDGSSDRTAEILQHFTEKDERVRFLTFSRKLRKRSRHVRRTSKCIGRLLCIYGRRSAASARSA